ncbi:alpha/beta fold hydrolase [Terrilactibacillus laevilacticus]|uniref:alpha/beta fold hydrolase n=1 Tax=Terrilactibacillus laevilacticus TaxID=1380157 RepID=UPI0011466EDC|nr:alpha/beta hydrolase [Terrilactibacillus laevilacticus]
MPYLKMKDYDLYYSYHDYESSRPTLVFIHGLSFDSSIWQSLLPLLGQNYNTLIYDIKGHGRSVVTTKEIACFFQDLCHEFRALINHLKLTKVHLIGSITGGNVALGFYPIFNHIVKSLTLLSTPFSIPNLFLQEEQDLHKTLTQKEYARQLAGKFIYPCTSEKRKIVEKALSSLNERGFNYPLNQQLMKPDLSSIDCPVLILHGEYDPLYPAHHAILYANDLRNARALIVANSSTLVALDRPEIVSQFLLNFLEDEKVEQKTVPFYNEDFFTKCLEDVSLVGPMSWSNQTMNSEKPILQIHTQGSFQVYWEGTPVEGTWNRRNAKELLVFLAFHDGVATRETIITMFFPHQSMEKARSALRVQLSHLHSLFKQQEDERLNEALSITREGVQLLLPVECDLVDYVKQLDSLFNPNESLMKRYVKFIDLLNAGSFNLVSMFRVEWFVNLSDKVDQRLTKAMLNIYEELKKRHYIYEMKRLLRKCEPIEPYEGFCKEKLQALNTLHPKIDKKSVYYSEIEGM